MHFVKKKKKQRNLQKDFPHCLGEIYILTALVKLMFSNNLLTPLFDPQ